ncbi:VOC family protein [Streptomyces europaeiscabiei]|uniref:VOC family protein n=1 Tax=Streptomyces europaeiscabiei TaxID=146819 RepID=UPI0029AD10DF|nr:VOC family protein [Streptomyces europaeiscabiei]MDX3586686.1 VOC family protein [Streptomyces europaeiscabiei]
MLRVIGLLHYGLQVPSLDTGASFYSAFGLETAERGDAVVIRCEGREQDQTLLMEGPVKRFHHVAFAVEPDSLPEWQRHLEDLGLKLLDGPAEAPGGLWFRDHEGNLVNLRDEGIAPCREFGTTDAQDSNVGDRVRRIDQARWRSATEDTGPQRLGHMLIFSSDVSASEAFYTRTLGLRLSDRIVGGPVFMNSGPGDHHVFGFVPGEHPGLHHSSWMVSDIDQIARGAQNMAAEGYTKGWGLGRHTLGSNLFHYIQDPWGSWIEYSSDMDCITENWQPTDWEDLPAAVWSPGPPPADFITNQEAKPA